MPVRGRNIFSEKLLRKEMMEMKPRERVLTALNHQEPDKVPIDCGGTQVSSLTLVANDRFKEYQHIDQGGEFITCPLTESIQPVEEILNLFETEFRTVRLKGPSRGTGKGFAAYEVVRNPPGHEYVDDLGTVWKKAVYDYAPVKYSLAGLSTSDLEKFPWPDPYDPGRVAGLREETKNLRDKTDFAIVTDIMVGGPFEQATRSRGAEQFMLDLAWDSKFAQTLLDKLTDVAMGMWDFQLNAIGDLVDVVCQGDDLGMQTGVQISPVMYRKFVKPCHERMFAFIHSKTKAKIFLHSCGSVYSIIPDLIEIGLNILNPIQVGAKDMGLRQLKKEFGRELTFWGGGIDIQKLPFQSQEEIEKAVKEALEIMAPGGGYVFAATHNILPETEGKKTYAAYMTAVKNRSYKSLRQV
jgi:uroporphyrinogen decarboxylase